MRTDDLELTRCIVLEGLRGRKARVYLFGSWAKGYATRTSDIDVAIMSEPALEPWELSLIRERLEESNVLYPVDVVDLRSAPAWLRERVLEEGILWEK